MRIKLSLPRMLSIFLLCASIASAHGETLIVPGLSEPVEIVKDRWGISHIYARNDPDLFFAQGFNAARDRLFQLELWRIQASGTAAQIFGGRELVRDTGARLLRYRGDLKQEFNWYHPRGSEIVAAFVRGINAYIAETEKNPQLLPVEFSLLGIKPGKWTSEIVISRHQGLLANISQELNLGQAVFLLGAERVRELSWFRPGEPILALDPAIQGNLLSDRILEIYDAYRATLHFSAEDIVPLFRAKPASASRLPTSEFRLVSEGEAIGSNNWVISGRKTLGGYPLLANDPHRAQSVPSLRYWVHLVAPGWNVIGGGEPSVPGVAIGHNEFGAWGFTIFGQDSEDLYVYETNPSDPLQYKYRGDWEAMRVLKEAIGVKNEKPVTVELKFTRHGPVLFEDRANHRAYALRAAWLEPGCAPYLASLRMDQAKNWEEFREACSYSRIPAENMVWADREKNIGYQAVSISPVRPNWSGLVPVPGDGRYEWSGYLPIKALPNALNPDKGYFATANNYTVPDGYPYPEALHYIWGDDLRAARIEEVLSQGRMNTVADMMKLQHDELSIPARNLVPLLREIPMQDPAVRRARDRLLSWDFVLDRDSIPAAIYVSWERRLQVNVRDLFVPENARRLLGSLNLKRVIDWILAPDGRFGENPVTGRDAILARSLEEAVAGLNKRLGPDLSNWRYGQEKFHYVRIEHPLSALVNQELRNRLDAGPLPRGGYASTVNATGNGDNQTSGASFRIIADTANWDNSVGTNTPGQSGDPQSPHYRDLFESWANGKYFPIFFSRSKIESVAGERISLAPPAGNRGR
jgi:penicillin G amidase